MTKGKHRIVVTEIPYQVNKARLIATIADLSRDKVVDGITALRDESDRRGLRIVIELRADVQPDIVLNKLYKHTQLQRYIRRDYVGIGKRPSKSIDVERSTRSLT